MEEQWYKSKFQDAMLIKGGGAYSYFNIAILVAWISMLTVVINET